MKTRDDFFRFLLGDCVITLSLTVIFILLGFLSHKFAIKMQASFFGGWGMF